MQSAGVLHISQRLPMEARRLEKKVAIITGGASGLGEATAKHFVSHGAHVIIADIQDDLGSKVASSLAPHAHFVHCNVADEDDVRALVDFAVSEYGHLDIMYNNAGIAGEGQDLPELDMDVYKAVMDINVRGVLLGIKHASRAMISKKRGGSILCTSSLAGMMTVARKVTPYTTSKHAVMGLMKSAAIELAPYGIRVNCVTPSAVMTPLAAVEIKKLNPAVDLDALGDKTVELRVVGDAGGVNAVDMANAALFLSSDEARYISGHNLVVDGAFTIYKNAIG